MLEEDDAASSDDAMRFSSLMTLPSVTLIMTFDRSNVVGSNSDGNGKRSSSGCSRLCRCFS